MVKCPAQCHNHINPIFQSMQNNPFPSAWAIFRSRILQYGKGEWSPFSSLPYCAFLSSHSIDCLWLLGSWWEGKERKGQVCSGIDALCAGLLPMIDSLLVGFSKITSLRLLTAIPFSSRLLIKTLELPQTTVCGQLFSPRLSFPQQESCTNGILS